MNNRENAVIAPMQATADVSGAVPVCIPSAIFHGAATGAYHHAGYCTARRTTMMPSRATAETMIMIFLLRLKAISFIPSTHKGIRYESGTGNKIRVLFGAWQTKQVASRHLLRPRAANSFIISEMKAKGERLEVEARCN